MYQEVAPDLLVHYEGVGLLHSSAKVGSYLERTHVSPGWRHASVNVDHQISSEYESRFRESVIQ